MRWLDTPESWDWMLDNWAQVFRAAGVTAEDRIFFAFSFGPFLGFWTAFECAARMGCLCIPGGGMRSAARLRTIIDTGATVLCCTPTYAIRLAEVAAEEKIDLAGREGENDHRRRRAGRQYSREPARTSKNCGTARTWWIITA